MKPPVKFALIGAGGIAQSYVQAFEGHSDAQLCAVVDTRADAAQALAERMTCPAFTDHQTLLKSGPEIDAAIICTPPNTHEELALCFAEHGKNILCEKPFALNIDSARRMIQAALKANVQITMASKFRYVYDMIRLKSLIASGVLGDILLIENAFTSRVDMSNRWNADPSISGGGVLIDNGTHSVDILRYLVGPIHDVMALEYAGVRKLRVEDSARMLARFTKGIQAHVDLSWSINKELDWFVSVFGTQGTAQVGWKQSRHKTHSAREWTIFGNGYDKIQAFRDILGNFARACRDHEPLLISPADAEASVQVIEAAYRSLRESGWFRVGPISDYGARWVY